MSENNMQSKMKYKNWWLNGLWIKNDRYNIWVLEILVTIEVLIAFSPLGFIMFPNFTFTTLYLVVLAGALWGGPFAGGTVGIIFGLCSMWKATVTTVTPSDLVFSPAYSGNTIGSIVLSVGSRFLFGVIAGIIYSLILRKFTQKKRLIGGLLVSPFLERVHAVLVYFFVDKIFALEGVNVWKAGRDCLRINYLIEVILMLLIMCGIFYLYQYIVAGKVYEEYRGFKTHRVNIGKTDLIIVFCGTLIVGLVTWHMWSGLDMILFQIDNLAPAQISSDRIWQVLWQSVVIAISAIFLLCVFLQYERFKEEAHEARMEKEKSRLTYEVMHDPLTGVFNRKGFDEITQTKVEPGRESGFILLDIDNFKEINDTFGHDKGDVVLKQVSDLLQKAFRQEDYVCRLGGDEFMIVMFDCEQKNWEIICKKLNSVHKKLMELNEGRTITLSSGVCFTDAGYSKKLYRLVDDALYNTKRNGRSGCTLIDENEQILEYWKDEVIC